MASEVAAAGGQFDPAVVALADVLEFEEPPIKFGNFSASFASIPALAIGRTSAG
jgi:hypothetical protein